MLRSVDLHFNNRFQYPIVVFEEDLTPAQKEALMAATSSNLTFRSMSADFTLPPFISASNVPTQTGCLPERGLGYRHMCRFQAGIVNRRLSELGFEWHWRLDDDSLLTGEVKYDVFGFMAAHNKLYGYVSRIRDDDACIGGLWDTAKDYAANQLVGNSAGFFEAWPLGLVFYNNFEISHASVWASKEYTSFFDHIDRSGGIYTRRWGDAPIKSIGVSLSLPPESLHHFGDLGYRHLPFIDQVAVERRRKDVDAPRHGLLAAARAQKLDKPFQSVVDGYRLEAQPDADLQSFIAPKAAANTTGWLGSDVATSVALGTQEDASGTERAVWLFGDTLVGNLASASGESGALRRVQRPAAQGGPLVRNSVGIVQVDSLSKAPASAMHAWWKPQVHSNQQYEAALAFRQSDGESVAMESLKPMAGLHYCTPSSSSSGGGAGGSSCELLLVGARSATLPAHVARMLGMGRRQLRGSVAVVVHNPHDPPNVWTYEAKAVPVPAYEGLVTWHAGVVRGDGLGRHNEQGEWAYLLGARFGWPEQVLARLPVADLADLDFRTLQVWATGPHSGVPLWVPQAAMPSGDAFAKGLAPIGAVGESTEDAGIWHDRTLQQWCIAVVKENQLVLRTSHSITGPWSSRPIYTLPSVDREHFAYAVRAHPELAVDRSMVLTYSISSWHDGDDVDWLFEAGEMEAHIPRFLRIRIHGVEGSA